MKKGTVVCPLGFLNRKKILENTGVLQQREYIFAFTSLWGDKLAQALMYCEQVVHACAEAAYLLVFPSLKSAIIRH